MFRRDKYLRVQSWLHKSSERVPMRTRLMIAIVVTVVFFGLSVITLVRVLTGKSSSLPKIEAIQLRPMPDDSATIQYEEAKQYKRFKDSLKIKR
jgi:hypothetical protein